MIKVRKHIRTLGGSFEEPEGEEISHFIGKKTISHPDGFSYKFDIVVIDLYEVAGDAGTEGKYAVGLYLVPTPNSLSKKALKEVANSMGVGTKYVDIRSIQEYGHSILLKDLVTTTPEKAVLGLKKESEMIEFMIGFYLDKPVNRVGETGWTVLKEIGALKK